MRSDGGEFDWFASNIKSRIVHGGSDFVFGIASASGQQVNDAPRYKLTVTLRIV